MPPLEMPTQQPRDMDELPRPFELVASVRATPVGPTVTKETKETKEAKETKGRAAGMAEVPQSKVPGAEAEHEVQRSAVPTSLLRDTRTGPGASTHDAVDPDTDAQRQRQLSRKRSRQEFRATRGPGTAELTAERQDAVDQLLASSPLVRGIELTLGVLGDSETKVTRPADTDHGRPAVQVPLAVAPSTMPSDPQETDSNSDSEPDDPEETDPRGPSSPDLHHCLSKYIAHLWQCYRYVNQQSPAQQMRFALHISRSSSHALRAVGLPKQGDMLP